MAKSRSTLLIIIGIGVFIVGTGLAFVVSRGGDSPDAKVQAAAPAAPKPGEVTTPGAAVPAFSIPAGKQAVAISLGRVQGVLGLVKAHDRVNLFGTVKSGSPAPAPSLAPTPAVKLILSNVEVLATTPPAAAIPDAPTTFVLALTAAEAEQVVYLQTFEGLYLSLARTDQGVVQTPGRAAGHPF